MKKTLLTMLTILIASSIKAQTTSTPFKGALYNEEYNVCMNIDFHGDGIDVPAHELFGALPGYLWKKGNSFYWLITSAGMTKSNEATLDIINDYGSEDLTATLTATSDSTYILKQGEGSALKIPNKGKWQKLPKALEFKRK